MTLAPWRLQPRATRLFVQQIIKTNNKANTKLQTTEFCEKNLLPVVSPHKWFGNAGIYINIMTVTQHIVAQYGDRESVNTDSVNGLLPDGTKQLPEPVLTYHR